METLSPFCSQTLIDPNSLQNFFKSQQNNLNFFFQNLNHSQTLNFTQTLLNTKGKIFLTGVGKSGIVAQEFSQTLVSIGFQSGFFFPCDLLDGFMNNLSKSDLVVLFSNSGDEKQVLNLVNCVNVKDLFLISVILGEGNLLEGVCDLNVHLPLEKDNCSSDLGLASSIVVLRVFVDAVSNALMGARNSTNSSAEMVKEIGTIPVLALKQDAPKEDIVDNSPPKKIAGSVREHLSASISMEEAKSPTSDKSALTPREGSMDHFSSASSIKPKSVPSANIGIEDEIRAILLQTPKVTTEDLVAKSRVRQKSSKADTMESEASGNEKGGFGNVPQLKKRFIQICLEEVNTCGYQGKSLKPVSWFRLKEKISEEFGLSFKQKDLKNKWDYLKKSYRVWRHLLNKSGRGYNSVTGTFDWPQSVWEDIIRQYPDTKKFRNKPLEYANELRALFEGALETEDTSVSPIRKNLLADIPRSEHESSPIDAPVTDSYLPNVCLAGVEHIPSTPVSEQGAQSDIGTSPSLGKRKRQANRDDSDMKAEVRDLIAVIKDQFVSEKAKEGPSLDDCTQVMNELLQEGGIDMRVYHGALLKFCECENYRKAFMGMQTLEHRIFFLTTLVGGS